MLLLREVILQGIHICFNILQTLEHNHSTEAFSVIKNALWNFIKVYNSAD